MHDFYAYHPCHWGETTDEERFFDLPSGILGRFSGQETIFQPSIRTIGEKSRTGSSTIHFADILGKKLPKCIEKQGRTSFLEYCPGIKQPKSCQSVFQNTTRQAQDKAFSNMDPYRLTVPALCLLSTFLGTKCDQGVFPNTQFHKHKARCANL